MGHGRFDAAQVEPVALHIDRVGRLDLDDLRAQLRHYGNGFVHHLARRRIDIVMVPAGIDADAQPLDAPLHLAQIIGNRQLTGRRIVLVGARDDLQHRGRILRAARHRPQVIERCRQLERAVAADAPPSRLDARQSASRGREADRAAGIGADRAIAKPGRRRHARPAGRHAGPVLGIPGIDGRIDVRMMVGERALGQLDLAQQDGAGLPQALHHRAVFAGLKLPVDRRSERGGRVEGPAQVFHRDGHPVQGAAHLALRDLPVRLAGSRHRAVLHEQDVALEAAVQFVDAFELPFGDGFRRDLAGLNGLADFAQSHVVQIIVIHSVLLDVNRQKPPDAIVLRGLK